MFISWHYPFNERAAALMGPPQPRGFVHCEEEARVSFSTKLLRSVKIPGLAVMRPVWMALQIQLCPILLKFKELAADLQG